jgi:hypothetical protein
VTAGEERARVRARVVELATALPEVQAGGEQHIGFSVRRRRFAWLLDDHHGDGRLALNCKAAPGRNAALAEARPSRCFIPSYLGARGWVGVWLDVAAVDWSEVEGLLVEAYRLSAPRSLVTRLG